MAQEVPKKFKNSHIQRMLDSGDMQIFDGDEYMIVKRKKKKSKVITRTITKKIYLRRGVRRNNLSIQPGLEPGFDPVLGVSYSRDLNEAIRIQGTILTNGTFLGGFGYNY